MKVLYLDHPEADFLAALTYLGLCEELGAENVIDYPYKRSYHGQIHTIKSSYTTDPGKTPWQEWYKAKDGVAYDQITPFVWMKDQPIRGWRRDEVISRIDEFDLIVLASPRKHNTDALIDLMQSCEIKRPIFILDGEDYTTVRWDLIKQLNPTVYFKREYIDSPPDTYQLERYLMEGRVKIVPFPFSSPIPTVEPKPKDIDIFMSSAGSWPSRQKACAALKNVFGSRFVGNTDTFVPYHDYLDMVNRSKIAISMRGHGFDTLRFWELFSFETMVISDRLPLIRPFPFEHNTHTIYVNNIDELIESVQHFLDNNTERERIAKAGNAHLRTHHTTRARAQQLLGHLP